MGKISRRDFISLGTGVCLGLATTSLAGCAFDESKNNKSNGLPGSPNAPGSNEGNGADRMSSVVHAITGNELSDLYDMARQAAVTLGITKRAFAGARIFIKPNLVGCGLLGYVGENGECTKAEIVAGVAEQCLEAGARLVVIGDGGQGQWWDWSTLTFLEGNSIDGATDLNMAVARLQSIYGTERVQLACLNGLDQWSYIPSCSSDNSMKNGLMVARHFTAADHVISLPVIKTHMWTRMTGSMKNYIGLTPVRQLGLGICRSKVHSAYDHATCAGIPNAGVAGAFIDMVQYRKDSDKEDFAIMDCSLGVEGSGPHTEPVNPGITIDLKARSRGGQYFLLASKDYVALDSVAARIIGFAEEVPQITMARTLGLGEPDNVIMKGADLSDLQVPDWLMPASLDDSFFTFLEWMFSLFTGSGRPPVQIYTEALRTWTAAHGAAV